tara:strand:+ start:117 stop:425 length:309 start_codon:yes stop_codon:yes gene_type:complete
MPFYRLFRDILYVINEELPKKARRIIGTILLSVGVIVSIIGVALVTMMWGEDASGLGGLGVLYAWFVLGLGIIISIIASTFFMKNWTETFDEILAEEDSESV